MATAQPLRAPLGANRENLRQHNLSAVLRLLHLSGAVPRTHLTSVTGLNRSTISDLVGELVALGLVTERDAEVDGSVGRPSRVVEPTDQVVAIAVNPETDATTVGVVSLDGRVLVRRRHPTRLRPEPEHALRIATKLISELRAGLPSGTRIVGVGVAVPGMIRVHDGVVRFAPHLGWVEVPLGTMLAQQTGLPVYVGNDAASACTAEQLYGAARGSAHAVYLHAGSGGIGGGVVVDNHLLRGASGYAGELGHMQISSSRATDYSGIAGSLEALVRRDDLLEVFKLDSATDEELDFDIMHTKDPRVLRLLHRQTDDLGRAVGVLSTIFNPQTVLLGGFLTSLFKRDAPRLLSAVRASSIAPASEGLVVRGGELGTAAVLIGAAELAIAPLLESPAGTTLTPNRR